MEIEEIAEEFYSLLSKFNQITPTREEVKEAVQKALSSPESVIPLKEGGGCYLGLSFFEEKGEKFIEIGVVTPPYLDSGAYISLHRVKL